MSNETGREFFPDEQQIQDIYEPRSYGHVGRLLNGLKTGEILRIYIEAANPQTGAKRLYEIHEIPGTLERRPYRDNLKLSRFIGLNAVKNEVYKVEIASDKNGKLDFGTIREINEDDF